MGKKQRENKTNRRRALRKKQWNTSIYFLLWATFTAFSLLIVLLLGISQGVMMSRGYKGQAARDVKDKGQQIQTLMQQPTPPEYEGNKSLFLRMLAAEYNVQAFILNGQGEVIYPQMPPVEGDTFDFSEEIVIIQEKLAEEENGYAVYEAEQQYVYVSKIQQYGEDAYVYVYKSLELMHTVSSYLRGRVVVTSVFIFVLAFAVSSALSAWLIRPIAEMTKKARKLARGEFDVDFHGNDYGLEMVELAETLNYARDELSKTDNMQKQLIANVSHDFKTPLTMIKGYASMIIEISGDNKQKREKHAQIIIDESDRLTTLVNDVLELSKMKSGIGEMKRESLDMSAYLKEILSRFAYLKETQGYAFFVEIEDGLCTNGDKVKLGQVLYNLIGNAVNYTGEDKKVYISLQRISATTFRFAVRDTGEGIKKEELGEIWERYYRSSESHKRPVKGTGLGLSIVKTVLQRHGFAFGVDSKEGEGSTFYVDFPLEEK